MDTWLSKSENGSMSSLRHPEEWIQFLTEGEEFRPFAPPLASGEGFGTEVIAGFAKVGTKTVGIFANDVRVDQGYVTSSGALKIRRLQERCRELGIPMIGLLSSPGVSISEGVASGEDYSAVLMGHCELSGVIPQIACVMGANIGATAYSATLMDLTLFQKARSYLCVSGPGVVAEMLGQETTYAELGGAALHASKTGIAHFVDSSAENQLRRARWFIDFFPSNYLEDPPRREPAEPTTPFPEIPSAPEVAFDVTGVISALVDRSEWIEYSSEFGRSMVTAFARLDGRPIGVIASQSLHLAGALDCDAAEKCARFIRVCDSYGIPLLSLVDSPGFMPGVQEESKGLLRKGALLCQAMKTRSPKVSVTLRKCYGAAAIVLSQTRKWRGDLHLSLDSARTAVMGYHAAKRVVFKDRKESDEILKAEYLAKYEAPEIAYRLGFIDQIVAPADLRATLVFHFEILSRKRENRSEPVRGIFP